MRQHFMRALVLATVSFLTVFSLFSQAPLEVRTELIQLEAEDGGRSKGAYYRPEGKQPKTAVLIMHPRTDRTTYFILQPLARNGLGAMGMMSRSAGHSGIHEELILDVAAGVRFLKSQGVENVILAGHSGGGSLMAFFLAQAETAPPNRIEHTPAGDPPNLNEFDLPKAQGLITLNAAEGEGLHIAHHLDPSVTDENDPFSYDPALDPYNPDDGWRVPPQISEYSARPDVMSVIHTHPLHSVVFSITGKPIVPVIVHGAIFGKGVPVMDHVGHVNSRELGDELARTLGDRQAVLMKMHGAVIVGSSVERAFAYSLHLEENAEKQLLAGASGGPVVGMTPAEIERCLGAAFSDRSIEKRWQYYQEKEKASKNFP